MRLTKGCVSEPSHFDDYNEYMGYAELNSVNELEMKQGVGKKRRMVGRRLKVKGDKATLESPGRGGEGV